MDALAFNGTWRTYQQHILDRMDGHMSDGRLHIVAAPGSGKTVVGIEAMRRIGRPALVLSPTLPIRNQWIDRVEEMFVPAGTGKPEWITTDISVPDIMTVSTYQGLHALWAKPQSDDESCDTGPEADSFAQFIAQLKAMGPVTLVLDEAHHLRREWWRALEDLRKSLDDLTIISLTATPPYDVGYAEWSRYDALCGPIDDEIAVAELVKTGDLAPHQDYLHLSLPAVGEEQMLHHRRAGLHAMVARLLDDTALLDAIDAHAWFGSPASCEKEILERPELLSAMLIFIKAAGRDIPSAPLDILGVKGQELPGLTLEWIEYLIDGTLRTHAGDFVLSKDWRKALVRELKTLNAYSNGRVRLMENRTIASAMARSSAKMDSIIAIASAEYAALQDDLHMVILTDYVRASDLPKSPGDNFAPLKIGAAPVFELLRRDCPHISKIGILTGSLVVIPACAEQALYAAAADMDIGKPLISLSPLHHAPDYYKVRVKGADARRIVQLVTRLFVSGDITILTGTQALLGEGWDAPAINSLILASNVGSFMLSNQMRGRAIRRDPAAPHKSAAIWHLATVIPRENGMLADITERFSFERNLPDDDPVGYDLGPDMELLKRRFLTFEGIGRGEDDIICNGLNRLDIAQRDWNREAVQQLNAEMLAQATQRKGIAAKWQQSIAHVTERPEIRQITRVNYTPRHISMQSTLQYFSYAAVAGGAISAGNAMRNGFSNASIGTVLMVLAGLTLVYSVPKLLKAAYLFLRHGSLEGSVNQVGAALLDSLDHSGKLSLPRKDYTIEAFRTATGKCDIFVSGTGQAEQRMIIDALGEILGPVTNPRYLLVRRSIFGLFKRSDYHAVPGILGVRKEYAEHFCVQWRKHVGSAKLVFTRSSEGRRDLLKARSRSLSAGLQRRIHRLSVWK